MTRKIYNYFNLVYEGFAFTDVVDGKPVYYYRDPDGVRWMKNSRWAFFAVRSERAALQGDSNE